MGLQDEQVHTNGKANYVCLTKRCVRVDCSIRVPLLAWTRLTGSLFHVDMICMLQLNPEVKLLRVLLRTDCDGVRKSMLQERLQLPDNDIFLVRLFRSNCNAAPPASTLEP